MSGGRSRVGATGSENHSGIEARAELRSGLPPARQITIVKALIPNVFAFPRLSCIAAGSVIQWPDENSYCATSRGVGGRD